MSSHKSLGISHGELSKNFALSFSLSAFHNQENEMKKSLLLVLGLIMILVAARQTVAQSSNRDRPTPLYSDELKGEFRGRGGESFYSFTAGPGELTITVDVKSIDGTFAMPFELLSANGADVLLCCEFAQADEPGKTGRDVKSVKLRRRQTVILHLTENNGVRGTFRVRLSGPVTFVGSPQSERNNPDRDSRDNGRTGVDVPASGTLRIRMKDGSTKEIDLSLVQSVSVRP